MKMPHRIISTLLSLLCAALTASAGTPSSARQLRDGDLVFQTLANEDGLAIQRGSGSPYTHVGLVLFRAGKPYVFEAMATARYTPLTVWVGNGEGGRFAAKRLAGPGSLTPDRISALKREAARWEGKPYDFEFAWSDDRVYCSELVWKVYDRALGVRLGAPKRLREFNLNDPLVQEKLRERFGENVPLDEPVVSPGQVFDSDRLTLIKAG